MRRVLPALLLLSLPLMAAGQALPGNSPALAQQLLQPSPDQFTPASTGGIVPLWKGADGHLLALKVENGAPATFANEQGLSYSVVDANAVLTTGMQYSLTPHLQAHADVTQHSWTDSAYRVIGSEVGASYSIDRYSLGLSISSASVPDSAPSLPRIIPGLGVGNVNGLSGFDSSSEVAARGRIAFGSQAGIDIGAGVGRIHLLPGNLLGLNTVDQKVLSFGVERGSFSGNITGRSMQPEPGINGVSGINAERRWNSIDLGVTFHLPWQGRLSVGAQNVWSSGAPGNTPAGQQPDQSRTPYVQYHQDL